MPSRPSSDRTPAFREAIAQWQLAARTAVKRSSSLPSSLFDACDPMLETRLAESARQLIAHLQKPTGFDQSEGPEMSMERVGPEELAQLRRRAGECEGALELDSGQRAEVLGVLLDMVATSPPPHNRAALELLRDSFGIAEDADLDDATRQLAELIRDEPGVGSPSAESPEAEAMIAALCSSIAGYAIVRSRRAAADCAATRGRQDAR